MFTVLLQIITYVISIAEFFFYSLSVWFWFSVCFRPFYLPLLLMYLSAWVWTSAMLALILACDLDFVLLHLHLLSVLLCDFNIAERKNESAVALKRRLPSEHLQRLEDLKKYFPFLATVIMLVLNTLAGPQPPMFSSCLPEQLHWRICLVMGPKLTSRCPSTSHHLQTRHCCGVQLSGSSRIKHQSF